jgi:hypothetical protein
MSYVDAGYAIVLSVLAVYAVGLLARRRRLTRAAALAEGGREPRLGATGTGGPSGGTGGPSDQTGGGGGAGVVAGFGAGTGAPPDAGHPSR